MTNNPKNGGPAFPGQPLGADGLPVDEAATGMSLRDWYATHCPITVQEAWGGWCSEKSYPFDSKFQLQRERVGFWPWFSMLRFEYADAMLAEREKSE